MKRVWVLLLLFLPWSGEARNVVLEENFEECTPPAFPEGWKVVNQNGDTDSFEVYENANYNHTPGGTKCARYSYNPNLPANDWFFTNAIPLIPSCTYKLSFWYRARVHFHPESFTVYLLEQQAPLGAFMFLKSYMGVINEEYRKDSIIFVAPEFDNYYLGFVCQSDTDGRYLFIDDIELEILLERDVSADSFKLLNSPLWLGDTAQLRGFITNQTDDPTGDFWVYFLVNEESVDSTIVSLDGQESRAVDFSWIPGSGGYYELKVKCSFPGDQIQSNDTVGLKVYVYKGPWVESFSEGIFPPRGWLVRNYDGYTEWLGSDSLSVDSAGAACFIPQEFDGPGGDWLITPRLEVGGSDTLSLWYKVLNPAEFGETLYVMVSEVSRDTNDFVIIDSIITDTTEYFQDWHQKKISLSQYSDKAIYLSFVYAGGWISSYAPRGILVDVIEGPFPYQNDIAALSIDIDTVISVGDSVEIKSTYTNLGIETVYNLRVSFVILDGEYSNVITIDSLPNDDTVEVLFSRPWIPDEIGCYRAWTYSLRSDQDQSNNSIKEDRYVGPPNVVWFEFFNRLSLPLGWQISDVVGTSGDWTIVGEGGGSPYQSPMCGNGQARFNSSEADSGDCTRLISSLFYLSGDSLCPYLDFWMYHDNAYPDNHDSLYVEVLVGLDTNFVTIAGFGRYSDFNGWSCHEISLARFKSRSLKISFRGKANGGNDIFIDQITVSRRRYVVREGDLLINEFVTREADNWVELKNLRDHEVPLGGCRLSNLSGSEDTLSGVLESEGYFVWQLQNLELDPEGDILFLLNAEGDTVDCVGYGNKGGAPAAPAGYSISRAPDGHDTGDYARDFNISADPTPGSANNAAPPELGGSLVINECDVHPRFPYPVSMIELYNPTDHPVVIDSADEQHRFFLSDGDSIALIRVCDTINPGEVRCIYAGIEFGLDLDESDVIYLYDGSLKRLDQMGFYGEVEDYSFQRYPDGAGPNDGYDFLSSGGNATLFDIPESHCYLNLAWTTVYETGFEDPSIQDTGYVDNEGSGDNPHPWVRSHGFLYWGNSTTEPIDTVYPSAGDSFLVCAMDSLGYDNNEYSWWYSLPEMGFDLSSYRSGKLAFDIWYSLEYAHDSLYLLITDKSIYPTDFFVLKAYTGLSSGWIHEVIDISAWCGSDPITGDPHDDIQIAFLLTSDDSIAGPEGAGFGAAIDNIKIVAGGNYLAPPLEFSAESYRDGYVSLHWEAPSLLTDYSFEKYVPRKRGAMLVAKQSVADRGVGKADGQLFSGISPGGNRVAGKMVQTSIPEKLVIPLNSAKRDISCYYIYRRQIGEKHFTLLDSTLATHYDDHSVQNGIWYEYYVTAVYNIPPYIGLPSERKWAKAGPPNEVLLLGDYAGGPEDSLYWSRFRFGLHTSNLTWDEWNVEYLCRYPDSTDLFQYEVIIWFSAGPGFEDITVAPDRVDNWLLNKPGRLMLINRDFARELESEAPPGINFWSRFKTVFGGDNSSYSGFLKGVEGDSVSNYWTARRLEGNFGFNDYALVTGEADPVFLYGEGATQDNAAATRYHSDVYGYKTFWAGFDIIDIDNALEIARLIRNVIDWFKGFMEPSYTRGDANADGVINITDMCFILDNITRPQSFPCMRAADTDANNSIDITDVVYGLSRLMPFPYFPPPDSCGYYPLDILPCDSFPPCGWYSGGSRALQTNVSMEPIPGATIKLGPAEETEEGVFEVPVVVKCHQAFSAFQIEMRIEDGNILEVTDEGTVSEDFDYFNSGQSGDRVIIMGLKGLEAGEDGKAKIYQRPGTYTVAKIRVSKPAGVRLVSGVLSDIRGHSILPSLELDVAESEQKPGSFYLSQNVPNPFSDRTVIRYALPKRMQVKLMIYDAAGRKVRVLVNGIQSAGYRAVKWDGKDDTGKRVAPGTYFCRFEAGEFRSVKKITLIR